MKSGDRHTTISIVILSLCIIAMNAGILVLSNRISKLEDRAQPSSELRNANAPSVAYLEKRAIAVCRDSHFELDGALETECGQLADELACNGKELLSDKGGNFWTEANFSLECEANW